MFIKFLFSVAYFLLLFIVIRFLDVFLDTVSIFHDNHRTIDDLVPSKWRKYFVFSKEQNNKKDVKVDNPVLTPADQIALNEENFEIELSSYDDYIEKVEDTKCSVWVVKVYPAARVDHIITITEWKKLKESLKPFKIRTASYKCAEDPRLCNNQGVSYPTFVLSMPKGFQSNGNVSFHLYDHKENKESFHKVKSENIFKWVKEKLYFQVKRVHSMAEVTSPIIARHQSKKYTEPSLVFIYKTNANVPPLLLTALSVKFTGRIKFYLLQSTDTAIQESIAMNRYSTYRYGNHKGENFSYSCMELFLKTLHPEVNDVFIISVVLLNMACWLELFFQKGGPLKRFVYYIWGFTVTNFLLVCIWLPVVQLLCLPQIQPIIQIFLKTLQKVMLTNIAAVIRQDFLQITQHIHIVLIGFIFYGLILGYCRFKLRNDIREIRPVGGMFSNDVEEFAEMFNSLLQFVTPSFQIYRFEARIDRILHRIMYPDLWLHSLHTNDYINYLPKWQRCGCNKAKEYDSDGAITDTELSSQSDNDEHEVINECFIPSYIIPTDECVICLESYKCCDLLKGLSCGHSFHLQCIELWLTSLNSQHRCPVCRWPADVTKGKCEILDFSE